MLPLPFVNYPASFQEKLKTGLAGLSKLLGLAVIRILTHGQQSQCTFKIKKEKHSYQINNSCSKFQYVWQTFGQDQDTPREGSLLLYPILGVNLF